MNSSDRKSIAPFSTPPQSRDELETVAADWIARRNGGGLIADEQVQLSTWLAADPRHEQAFEAMEASWAALNELRRVGRADVIWTGLGARRRRRRVFGLVGAGLAAAAAVLIMFVPLERPSQPATVVPASVTVRPALRVLPDGSIVELNIGAEIALAFSAEKRGVRLLRGEALFTVSNDAARPFVVTAGAVEVRAVGTAFAVRHESNHVNVLVTEGRVAVERGGDVALARAKSTVKAEPVYLSVGNLVVVPVSLVDTAPLKIQSVSADDLVAALAWRGKRIEFTDTPLPEDPACAHRPGARQAIDHRDGLGG